jgi:hypothetical protein
MEVTSKMLPQACENSNAMMAIMITRAQVFSADCVAVVVVATCINALEEACYTGWQCTACRTCSHAIYVIECALVEFEHEND